MVVKKILIQDIIDFLGDQLIDIYGDLSVGAYIDNIVDVERVNLTSLDWVNPSKSNKQQIAESSKAQVLLVDKSIVYSDSLQADKKVLLVVSDPKVSLAYIGNHFFVPKSVPFISDKAEISSEAKIGANVSIGAFSVIGNCVIGENTIIDSNVHIYDGVIIGNNCRIKSGAVLGGEGFGFEKAKDGNLFRFPQIGGLVIGNYVEIGANTCIDRGALADTIIGDYTKINNLCHIAHNNVIGKNVVITGAAEISGSNIIEDDVWIAPNSSLRGWITVGKGATIGMGAAVVTNVPAGETWVGCPAKKLGK